MNPVCSNENRRKRQPSAQPGIAAVNRYRRRRPARSRIDRAQHGVYFGAGAVGEPDVELYRRVGLDMDQGLIVSVVALTSTRVGGVDCNGFNSSASRGGEPKSDRQ